VQQQGKCFRPREGATPGMAAGGFSWYDLLGRPGSGVTIGSLASVLADVDDQRRSFG
jgi:hypothetical protein